MDIYDSFFNELNTALVADSYLNEKLMELYNVAKVDIRRWLAGIMLEDTLTHGYGSTSAHIILPCGDINLQVSIKEGDCVTDVSGSPELLVTPIGEFDKFVYTRIYRTGYDNPLSKLYSKFLEAVDLNLSRIAGNEVDILELKRYLPLFRGLDSFFREPIHEIILSTEAICAPEPEIESDSSDWYNFSTETVHTTEPEIDDWGN